MLQQGAATEARIAIGKTSVVLVRNCMMECKEHLSRNPVKLGESDMVVEVDILEGGNVTEEGCIKDSGVERDSGRCFAQSIADKTSTLLLAIDEYILPGTHIILDGCLPYHQIPDKN